MIYAPSPLAIGVFVTFILIVIGLSAWLGRRAKSAAGYFAAHGQIPWFVNGVAFAGDYLSAASFLGICGMIAFYGYDGFLYSIGYLAGWIVALFVIAEPMKRLGKFTFADALDSRFHSRGIKLAAGDQHAGVSLFYLIPQMVGAGALVTAAARPAALGRRRARRRRRDPHRRHRRHGVDDLGAVHQGSLLVVFSTRADGDDSRPRVRGHARAAGEPQTIVKQPRWHRRWSTACRAATGRADGNFAPSARSASCPAASSHRPARAAGVLQHTASRARSCCGQPRQVATPTARTTTTLLPEAHAAAATCCVAGAQPDVRRHPQRQAVRQAEFPVADARPVLRHGVAAAHSDPLLHGQGRSRGPQEHRRRHRQHRLLLRADAVPRPRRDDQRRARRDRHATWRRRCLARSFGELLFAIISAIAFTTVLGTVSGLIIAASGAVAHDLLDERLRHRPGRPRARCASARSRRSSSASIAIVLGILFEQLNVSFLVGWAFSVAASANLPSLVMLLFWSGRRGRASSPRSSSAWSRRSAWILLSGDTFETSTACRPRTRLVPVQPAGQS